MSVSIIEVRVSGEARGSCGGRAAVYVLDVSFGLMSLLPGDVFNACRWDKMVLAGETHLCRPGGRCFPSALWILQRQAGSHQSTFLSLKASLRHA